MRMITTMLFFPTNKIKRKVPEREQQSKFSEEIKKQQTKDFVESLTDDIALIY